MGWDGFECLFCFGEWCKDYTHDDIWSNDLNYGNGYYYDKKYWCVCLNCKNHLNLYHYYNWTEDFFISNLYNTFHYYI